MRVDSLVMNDYEIKDIGDRRILIIENKEYETNYSQKVIELIIRRKGLARAPQYFKYKKERARFFSCLFRYLDKEGLNNLKVLEVGCSTGHLTEFLNEQPCFREIYTYDTDKLFVEITRLKIEELGLGKVKRSDCFSTSETRDLPYEDNFFDLIIVSATLEHLPYEDRYLYVDEYYRKLRIGGLICFFDTPNRNFLLETHSTGLPFINRLPPQAAFIYAKLFARLKGIDFSEFVRPNTAWRNATYYECLPHAITIDVKDISEEAGYGYSFFVKDKKGLKFKFFLQPYFSALKFLSDKIGFPVSFFLPCLNLVFKKVHNYEKEI